MVLDISLLKTQHYKVRIKSKVDQSKERSSALQLGVVAIENKAFWLPSTTVASLTFIYIYIYNYNNDKKNLPLKALLIRKVFKSLNA